MRNLYKFIKIFLFLIFPFLVSGYGYMGKLPELGQTTEKILEKETKPAVDTEIFKIQPSSIIVPRAASGFRINKYSNYLTDVKKIEYLLKEIKILLEQNEGKNKVQLFCAKTYLLNLYMDIFKKKYSDRPEKYYESYKQLVVLDEYLKEISDYKKVIEKYKNTRAGIPDDKLKDENYLSQRVNKAIMPINTVIDIIDDTEGI